MYVEVTRNELPGGLMHINIKHTQCFHKFSACYKIWVIHGVPNTICSIWCIHVNARCEPINLGFRRKARQEFPPRNFGGMQRMKRGIWTSYLTPFFGHWLYGPVFKGFKRKDACYCQPPLLCWLYTNGRVYHLNNLTSPESILLIIPYLASCPHW